MPRCGSGEAKPLWRFDGSQCGLMWGLGRRTRVCHRADVGWRQCESGFWDDAAGEKRRYGSETQSRPLSVIADEERTYGGRNDAGAHAATRNVGGARMGCPRTKVSMTVIAAPQCGQTKVGAMLAAVTSGGCDSVAAGTTCSSSRARAR